MSIPNTQLITWSKYVPHVTAQESHTSIRKNLKLETWPDSLFDVYLQGSYKNHTNVRGSSDVDVVVQLDLQGCWDIFRRDVLNALQVSYGNGKVIEGNKSIKVEAASFNADVVVCERYDNVVEGMRFYTRLETREVINYPKLHIRNGEDKNDKLTGGLYKPTVRIFKNMRNRLIERDRLESKTASSYFVECLLYNAPNKCFTGDYNNIVYNVLKWLDGIAYSDWDRMKCQNGQTSLIGESPEEWPKCKAYDFRSALISMWDGWGK